MKFNFYVPTEICFEEECVKKNAEIFRRYGSRAFIVTGKHSAKACGALDDVEDVLKSCGISSQVYNKIENNPSVVTIEEAASLARVFNAEFIIAIGGGSPLDAAKAIGVLTQNRDLTVMDLFQNAFTSSVPVIAIPTTSGTGSEVTPYSVLLVPEKETKLSLGNRYTIPKVALLDPRYTEGLSESITINTAIDAFTHAFEGYLANRSTPLSEAISLEAIRVFAQCFTSLMTKDFTRDFREKIMYVSLLGGIIIAQTGVTIAHGMGYCLTYFHKIPHGKANGMLMNVYTTCQESAIPEKMEQVFNCLGMTKEEFVGTMDELSGPKPKLSEEDCQHYARLTMQQKGSIANTAASLDESIICEMWRTFQSTPRECKQNDE